MTTVAQAETNRTQTQAEASRVNGAKSRGPATAEGRERSRWNALRHGLAAEKVVVPAEDREEFECYREAFFDDQQPAGALEVSLVERIAVLSWRLRRAVEMEAGLIAADQWDAHKRQCQMDKRDPGREDKDWTPPGPTAVGRVLRVFMSGPNCPYDTVGRYERRLERGYFQTIRELRELRKDRERGMGNGEQDAGTSGREPQGSASPAEGRFGDASMYGMSAAGAGHPLADSNSGQAPPGKKKMTSWHYGPEYPGGCLVEERWVDVTVAGSGLADGGLAAAAVAALAPDGEETQSPKMPTEPQAAPAPEAVAAATPESVPTQVDSGLTPVDSARMQVESDPRRVG